MVREKHSSVGKAPHKNHGDVSSILEEIEFWIYSINDTIVQYAFSRQEQNTIQRKPGSLHLTKINYDTMM